MIKAADIRKTMRITHDKSDEEIRCNMSACLLDMQRVGISAQADDALVDKAMEIYCKAQFDYQGRGNEFQAQYERLRDAMSLCEAYRHHGGGDRNV